jgi:hypothetical protein
MLCACLQPARAPKVEILLRTSGAPYIRSGFQGSSRIATPLSRLACGAWRNGPPGRKPQAGPAGALKKTRDPETRARDSTPGGAISGLRPASLPFPRQALDMSAIFREEKSKLISILWLVGDAVRAKRSPVEANSLLSGKRTGNLAKMCASSQIVVSNSNSQSIG